MEGVGLTAAGHRQARELAIIVAQFKPQRVIASPRQRAQETAGYISAASRIELETEPDFDECDFGDWTGMSFEALETLPEWKLFNQFRSASSAPHGESIADVQYRAIEVLLRLRAEKAGQAIVVVTHADVVRAALSFFFGTPLDLLLRFAIDPASFSIVDVGDDGPVVRCVNRIDSYPA
jgi:broad specificity phosphatase PhoE